MPSHDLDLRRYKMRETRDAVYFWGGPLSQWFLAPFRQRLISNGGLLDWNCAEQYMMGAKAYIFGDIETLDAIRREKKPDAQKQLGRQVRNFDLVRWNSCVNDILVRGNLAKFYSNRALRAYLLSTDGKRLVEGSPVDRIYGVGLRYDDPRIEDERNWLGENRLGAALTVVRDRLRDLS